MRVVAVVYFIEEIQRVNRRSQRVTNGSSVIIRGGLLFVPVCLCQLIHHLVGQLCVAHLLLEDLVDVVLMGEAAVVVAHYGVQRDHIPEDIAQILHSSRLVVSDISQSEQRPNGQVEQRA